MKSKDLRERNQEDLVELEKSLAKDVFENRLKNFTNRLDDTSSMKKARRDLARVKTILIQRKLGQTPVAAPKAEKPAKAAKAKAAPKAAPSAPKAAGSKPAKKTSKKSEAK
jgi:large subunit ribosomal protein L29